MYNWHPVTSKCNFIPSRTNNGSYIGVQDQHSKNFYHFNYFSIFQWVSNFQKYLFIHAVLRFDGIQNILSCLILILSNDWRDQNQMSILITPVTQHFYSGDNPCFTTIFLEVSLPSSIIDYTYLSCMIHFSSPKSKLFERNEYAFRNPSISLGFSSESKIVSIKRFSVNWFCT